MPGAGRRITATRAVVGAVAVSSFGTWSYNVGIAVYAYERTHSASWVAIVTVGRYLPAVVISWLAAGLIDRLPRRGLAATGDVLCAAIMAVLALLAHGTASLWLITLVAALSSGCARIQAAALLSLAADVVPESRVARTSMLTAAAEAVSTALGSAAASALLVAVDPAGLFLVNGATFLLSAVLTLNLRAVGARGPTAGRSAAPAPDGVRGLQAARVVAAYVYGADIVLLAVVAARDGHPGAYGLLLAAAGVGGVLALVPTRRRAGGASTAAAALGGTALYVLPLLALAPSGTLYAGLGGQVVRGAGAVLVTAAVMGTLQRTVLSAAAGRVFGTTQSLVLIGTCAGSLGTAGLLSLTGTPVTVVVTVGVALVAQLVVHPQLRRVDRRDARELAALDPKLGVLRSLDLLRDANRATLYEIAESVEEITVPPGRPILTEGDPADALYVLLTGRVEVTDAGGNLLRTMTAPDHIGELGLLHRSARTATVATLDTCRLWRVPGDRFLAAIAEAGVSGTLAETAAVRVATVARA